MDSIWAQLPTEQKKEFANQPDLLHQKIIQQAKKMPDVLNKACQQRKILQQIAPDRLRGGGEVLEYLDPRWYAARARGNTAEMKAIADKWTGREVAGCKIAAVTGTGILVTLATGGTGFIPYAFGVSAATAAAVGLDTHIQQAVAEGRVVDATKMASYHIPLLGSGRHIFDAYKKRDLLGMGFYAGMMGIEGFGLRGALKEIYRLPKQGGSAGGTIGSTTPVLGEKLKYLFGKATGDSHNIQRSTDMARQLNKIGIFDNAAGKSHIRGHLGKALNDTAGVLQSNGRIVRETVLTGPNGVLKVESVWDGSRLITVKMFE